MEEPNFENDATKILDTIPVMFRSKDQILYSIDYLQVTDPLQKSIMESRNDGNLSFEQFKFLNNLIIEGRQVLAIAALLDALEGLNLLY